MAQPLIRQQTDLTKTEGFLRDSLQKSRGDAPDVRPVAGTDGGVRTERQRRHRERNLVFTLLQNSAGPFPRFFQPCDALHQVLDGRASVQPIGLTVSTPSLTSQTFADFVEQTVRLQRGELFRTQGHQMVENFGPQTLSRRLPPRWNRMEMHHAVAIPRSELTVSLQCGKL